MSSIQRNGYAAALIGVWCGAIPVASVSALLSWWLFTREWVEPGQVRGMGAVFLAAVIGTMMLTAVLGGYWGSCMSAVLGCWLALELRGHRLAGYTAGMLFALLTVASLIFVIVWSETESMRSVPFVLGVFAFNLFVAPVVARGIALLVDAAD